MIDKERVSHITTQIINLASPPTLSDSQTNPARDLKRKCKGGLKKDADIKNRGDNRLVDFLVRHGTPRKSAHIAVPLDATPIQSKEVDKVPHSEEVRSLQ